MSDIRLIVGSSRVVAEEAGGVGLDAVVKLARIGELGVVCSPVESGVSFIC